MKAVGVFQKERGNEADRPRSRSRRGVQTCSQALPFPAVPCPALPCRALSCPALSCPALPCPALPCGPEAPDARLARPGSLLVAAIGGYGELTSSRDELPLDRYSRDGDEALLE